MKGKKTNEKPVPRDDHPNARLPFEVQVLLELGRRVAGHDRGYDKGDRGVAEGYPE